MNKSKAETMESPRLTVPEVVATARRRQFSSGDKRRILDTADRCTQPGEIGALLRKEGIYSQYNRASRSDSGL